jgi:hypothetical protein
MERANGEFGAIATGLRNFGMEGEEATGVYAFRFLDGEARGEMTHVLAEGQKSHTSSGAEGSACDATVLKGHVEGGEIILRIAHGGAGHSSAGGPAESLLKVIVDGGGQVTYSRS